MGECHCGHVTHACSRLWVHPLHCSLLLTALLPTLQCWVDFIMLSSCGCVTCTSAPPHSLSLSLPSHWWPRRPSSSHIHAGYHHHHLRSRFHKWVRTCDIWLLNLAYLMQYVELQFHPSSWKWQNFLSLYDDIIFCGMCACVTYFSFPSSVVGHLGWLHSLLL
jgi:hypothetical protein